jgi:hypothetical protein
MRTSMSSHDIVHLFSQIIAHFYRAALSSALGNCHVSQKGTSGPQGHGMKGPRPGRYLL